MYIPHGNYPKSNKFNSIEMSKKLFNKVDFQDFVMTIGGERANDFFASQIFLYASQFQENYGSKLVMLLSAVEKTNGRWKSLESILRSKKFKKKFSSSDSLDEAYKKLDSEIEDYLDSFGSIRSVVKFYTDNLTTTEKRELVSGILYARSYKRKKTSQGLLLTPVQIQDKKELEPEDLKRINYKLSKRLKEVVYTIRNAFVHKAHYTPFPDKKFMKNQKYFQFTVGKNGLPHKEWLISLRFERLHKLTNNAFDRFWLNEYKVAKNK